MVLSQYLLNLTSFTFSFWFISLSCIFSLINSYLFQSFHLIVSLSIFTSLVISLEAFLSFSLISHSSFVFLFWFLRGISVLSLVFLLHKLNHFLLWCCLLIYFLNNLFTFLVSTLNLFQSWFQDFLIDGNNIPFFGHALFLSFSVNIGDVVMLGSIKGFFFRWGVISLRKHLLITFQVIYLSTYFNNLEVRKPASF